MTSIKRYQLTGFSSDFDLAAQDDHEPTNLHLGGLLTMSQKLMRADFEDSHQKPKSKGFNESHSGMKNRNSAGGFTTTRNKNSKPSKLVKQATIPSRQFVTLENKIKEINTRMSMKQLVAPISPKKLSEEMKQNPQEFFIDMSILRADENKAVDKFEISEQTVSDSEQSKRDFEASNSVGKISDKGSGNQSEGTKAPSGGGSGHATARAKLKKLNTTNLSPTSDFSSFSSLEKVLVNINKRKTETALPKRSYRFQIELQQAGEHPKYEEENQDNQPATQRAIPRKKSPYKENTKAKLTKLNLNEESCKEAGTNFLSKGALSCRYSQRPFGIADVFHRSPKKDAPLTSRMTESHYPESLAILTQAVPGPTDSSCITLAEGLKELTKTQFRMSELRTSKVDSKKSPISKHKTFKKQVKEENPKTGPFLDELRLTIIPRLTESEIQEEDLPLRKSRGESEMEEGALLSLFEAPRTLDDDTIIIRHDADTLFNLPMMDGHEIPEDF